MTEPSSIESERLGPTNDQSSRSPHLKRRRSPSPEADDNRDSDLARLGKATHLAPSQESSLQDKLASFYNDIYHSISDSPEKFFDLYYIVSCLSEVIDLFSVFVKEIDRGISNARDANAKTSVDITKKVERIESFQSDSAGLFPQDLKKISSTLPDMKKLMIDCNNLLESVVCDSHGLQKQLEKLSSDNHDLHKKNEDYDNQLKSVVSDNNELREELQSVARNLHVLRNELKQVADDNYDLRKEVQSIANDNHDLRKELQSILNHDKPPDRSSDDGQSADIADLPNDNYEYKQEIISLNERINELQHLLTQANEENLAESRQSKQTINRQHRLINNLRKRNKDLSQSLDQLSEITKYL